MTLCFGLACINLPLASYADFSFNNYQYTLNYLRQQHLTNEFSHYSIGFTQVSNDGMINTYVYQDGTLIPISYNYTLTPNPGDHGSGVVLHNGDDLDLYWHNETNYNLIATPATINTIGTISGDFITNSGSGQAGGLTNNAFTINNLYGDFIENTSTTNAGGLLNLENGLIGNIVGNFLNNNGIGYGGGIDNEATITNITSNFVGNIVNHPASGSALVFGTAIGGGIYNAGAITGISGDFIDNRAYNYFSDSITSYYFYSFSGGGALYNGKNLQPQNNVETNIIENIQGNFIGNSAVIENIYNPTITDALFFRVEGGAIFNNYNGQIQNINSDFYNNFVNIDNTGSLSGMDTIQLWSRGGAIYNNGIINNITGSFINNSATINNNSTFNTENVQLWAFGGAIYNGGQLGLQAISNDILFSGNSATLGGAIYNTSALTMNIAENQHIIFDTVSDDIYNSGTITVSGDGTLYLQSISGNGVLNLNNHITHLADNATFQQYLLQLAEGSILYATPSSLLSDTGVLNDGTLFFSDGVLSTQITGSGNIIINGDVVNDSYIGNQVIINYGHSLTTAAGSNSLHNGILNNGTLYLTTGSLSTWTDITGDGTIITLGNISGNAGQFGNDIVNDYTLTLTGFTGGTISNGTISNNISGKGNIIIDGFISNEALLSESIIINENKTLSTSANGIGGTVNNAGTLTLTGGTLNNQITGDGSMIVTGYTYTSANNLLGTGSILNISTLELTGGTLQQVVYGNGNIVISGDVYSTAPNLQNNIIIADENTLTLTGGTLQKTISASGNGNIVINGDVSTWANYLLASTSLNDDTVLTLNGGALSTQITGTGTLAINNDYSVSSSANNIGVDVNNNGSLRLTGGTLSNDITGSGQTIIDGAVINEALISQSIVVNSGKSLTTATSGISTNIVNYGEVILTGGTLANNISGGDITINGTVSSTAELLATNNAITNNGTLNITSGNLQQNITGGNTIIVQGATTSATSFGNLELNGVMNVGTNTVTVANADINGTINLGISSLNQNSSVYTGGHIIANDITFGDNATLNLTITDTNLQKGDSSGDIEIITANGEWTGDIATFTSNNLYDIAYNTENHTFTFTRKKFGADLITELNGTELDINIAGVWDELQSSDNPNIQNIINAIDYNSQHNATKYAKLIHNLAPQNHQVTVGAVRSVSTLIDNHVFTRLATLRRPQINGTNANPRKRRANPFYYYGNYRGRNGGDTESTANNGIWVEGLYNYAQQKDDTKFSGNTFGVMGGFDSKLTEHLTAGLGYAFNKTNIDADNHDIDAMGHTGFVYAEYKPTQWYLDALLSYNLTNYQNSAALIDNLTVKSDYKTNSLSGALTSGYDFQKGLDLYGGLNYIGIKQDAYTDTAGQYVKADDTQTLTLKAGGRYKLTSQKMKRASTVLKAAVLYDVMSDDGVTTVTVGNNNYIVHGNGIDPFGVQAGIMFDSFGGNTYLSLGYDLEWRNNFISHTGYIKLKYNF